MGIDIISTDLHIMWKKIPTKQSILGSYSSLLTAEILKENKKVWVFHDRKKNPTECKQSLFHYQTK